MLLCPIQLPPCLDHPHYIPNGSMGLYSCQLGKQHQKQNLLKREMSSNSLNKFQFTTIGFILTFYLYTQLLSLTKRNLVLIVYAAFTNSVKSKYIHRILKQFVNNVYYLFWKYSFEKKTEMDGNRESEEQKELPLLVHCHWLRELGLRRDSRGLESVTRAWIWIHELSYRTQEQ